MTETVNKEFVKILKTPDGSMTFLVTGFKNHYRERYWAGEDNRLR